MSFSLLTTCFLTIYLAINKARDIEAQRFTALKTKQRDREKVTGASIYGPSPAVSPPADKTHHSNKATMAKTKAALAKAQQANSLLKKTNSELNRENTNLKRDNDALQKSNETMTEAKNGMEESAGAINEELNGLKTANAGLKSANDHAQGRITDLQAKSAEDKTQFAVVNTDLKEAQRELKALQESNTIPEGDDDATVGRATHSDEEFNELKKSNKELTTTNKELTSRNQELKEALEIAYEALKEGGKFSKKEFSKNVMEKIDIYVKGDGYREWKFVQGKTATEKFMSDVHKNVVAALPTMDEYGNDDHCSREDFMRIYTLHSCKTQRNRRHYSQTLMFKALVRKSTLCWLAPKLFPMVHLTSLFFSLRFSQETRIHPYSGGNHHRLCPPQEGHPNL